MFPLSLPASQRTRSELRSQTRSCFFFIVETDNKQTALSSCHLRVRCLFDVDQTTLVRWFKQPRLLRRAARLAVTNFGNGFLTSK